MKISGCVSVAGAGLFVILTYTTAPIAIAKTVIGVIQLQMAVSKIAAQDKSHGQ